jgi:serine/threonine protein kinase
MKIPKLSKLVEQTTDVDSGPRTAPTSAVPDKKLHDVPFYAMSAKEAYDVLKSFSGKLEQAAGIDVGAAPQNLGQGATGNAFRIADNTVMKVTVDRNEANACQRIKGKQLKNVYEIYNVFEVVEEGSVKWADKKYFIHQEFLAKPDNTITNYWRPANRALKAWQAQEWSPAQEDEKLEKAFYNFFNMEYGDPGLMEHIFKPLHKAMLEVKNGLEELLENKIIFKDYHKNNIMKRPSTGQIVLIDLGVSRSPEARIDKLEAKALESLFKHQMNRIL